MLMDSQEERQSPSSRSGVVQRPGVPTVQRETREAAGLGACASCAHPTVTLEGEQQVRADGKSQVYPRFREAGGVPDLNNGVPTPRTPDTPLVFPP